MKPHIIIAAVLAATLSAADADWQHKSSNAYSIATDLDNVVVIGIYPAGGACIPGLGVKRIREENNQLAGQIRMRVGDGELFVLEEVSAGLGSIGPIPKTAVAELMRGAVEQAQLYVSVGSYTGETAMGVDFLNAFGAAVRECEGAIARRAELGLSGEK